MEEGADGCYLSFGLSQSVVNIGNVLEVGGDPGAQVLHRWGKKLQRIISVLYEINFNPC
jgi:hypothetical protein